MNVIAAFINSIVDLAQAQVLAYLILANLALGIAAALKQDRFQLARLADFLKRLGIVFGAYLGAALAARTVADFEPLRTAGWAALIAFMVAHILGNLKDLGLPIPDKLQKYIARV